MKKVITIFGIKKVLVTLTVIFSLSILTGCGPSACDCVEAMEFSKTWQGFRINTDMTAEETGQCVRDYYTSGTLGRPSAMNSALINARKECD